MSNLIQTEAEQAQVKAQETATDQQQSVNPQETVPQSQVQADAQQQAQVNTQEQQTPPTNVTAAMPQAVVANPAQAKPPKPDFTATDATIQGLLVQVIALQHNKIQQVTNPQQE